MAIRYHLLTKKALYKRLVRRNLEFYKIERIIERAQARRKAEIRARRIGNNLIRAWEEYIAPLKVEINRVSVRRAEALKQSKKDRQEFYEAYAALLNKTLKKLRLHQRVGGEYPAHYEKASWVDWIPAHIREAFRTAHAELYKNFKARQPAPLFQLTDTKAIRATMAERVIADWTDEYRNAEEAIDRHIRDGFADGARYERMKMRLIDQAIRRVKVSPKKPKRDASWMNYTSAEDADKLAELASKVFVK